MIVDIELDGKAFQVDCVYSPFSKGYCDGDGSPLEPDTEAELEITAIRDDRLVSLTNFIRDFVPEIYGRIHAETLKQIEEGED